MASSPSIPDPNAAAQAGAIASVGNYPFQAYIDALAQTGGKAKVGNQTYDFTGLGTADQNAAVSGQMAQALLDIQKNYGPQYVAQRLADLKQADPTGYAAHSQLFDRILSDAQANPNRPMATDLQNQVQALVGQGSNLSTGPGSETEQVQQQVRGQQLANGIFLGNAPASQEATALVNAGDQQQQQRQQVGLSFLNSGVSPEDVTYRRIQQSLSNLGNAINGTTPEAQFSSLSAAANGAAPFNTGNVQSPTPNTQAGLQSLTNAADIYSGNVNWASQQVNPWTVGLSGLAGTANTLSSSGLLSKFGAPSVGGDSVTGTGYGTLPSGAPATAADYAAGAVAG